MTVRLYHFTSTRHLPYIQQAGYLKTVESNLDAYIEHAGPDVVWLLDEGQPSAGHGLNDAPPGVTVPDKTEIRFTVDVPDKWVKRWLPWAEAQGIDPSWLQSLTGGTVGGRAAAEHWHITFRPIRSDHWTAIDIRQPDGTWEAIA